jgi:hypothetical protein
MTDPGSDPTDGAADLAELAARHGSDKAEHGYTSFYEELFHSRRQRPLRILELGVGGYERQDDPAFGGGSLRMWKGYFPHAEIWGLDILDKSGVAEDRIGIIQGSQTDEELLWKLHRHHGPFDIVIDDASHIPALTNETFRILFPLLAPDGVYVIEDVATSYWPLWGGRFRRGARTTTMGLVKQRLDGLNHAEVKLPNYRASKLDTSIVEVRARHNIVALVKGDNTLPSDLNRANPVGVVRWVRDDVLPVGLGVVRRPAVLGALDKLGVRRHAARLRSAIVPNDER